MRNSRESEHHLLMGIACHGEPHWTVFWKKRSDHRGSRRHGRREPLVNEIVVQHGGSGWPVEGILNRGDDVELVEVDLEGIVQVNGTCIKVACCQERSAMCSNVKGQQLEKISVGLSHANSGNEVNRVDEDDSQGCEPERYGNDSAWSHLRVVMDKLRACIKVVPE